jgi:parallel beta-helix repeat protein
MSSWSRLSATVILIALVATSFATACPNASGGAVPTISATATAVIDLSVHDPILIDGNGGFTNDSGVVWGSGTMLDPYVIEGWDIQGSDSVTCIDIENTDAHAVVRDCYVHDCGEGTGESGILLLNCTNVTIDECTSYNNDCGIYLVSSSAVTVRSSVCSQNSYGIALAEESRENSIEENDCSNGNGYGIYLWVSDGNVISHNNCSWNGQGICLSGADNNSFIGNNCDHTGKGFELDHCCNNILISNSCNFNRDEGIRLTGQSDNNTLQGNDCSHNDFIGIEVVISSGNTVVGNTVFSNGGYGIFVEASLPYGISRCNQIASNAVSDNALWGIIASPDSESNRFWNNALVRNNGATDMYNPSHVQANDDGSGNWWNSTEGSGNWWNDWTAPDDYPPYGIVDMPYVIAGNSYAEDYYPLVESATPVNTPPVVVLSVSPEQGPVDTDFTFDASQSWDAEDSADLLQVRWDWEDDGTFDTGWSTEKITTHVYSAAGSYSPTVEVMDSGGLVIESTVEIVVYNPGVLADPSMMIGDLVLQIQSWHLPKGTQTGLTSKLLEARKLLNTGNDNGALHKMMALVSMVNAMDGKKLASAQAEYVLSSAKSVMDLIKGVPVAIISGPSQAELGDTVVFDGLSSLYSENALVEWQWDLGDGMTSTGPIVEHAYALHGVHHVSLVVTDSSGRSSSAALAAIEILSPAEFVLPHSDHGFDTDSDGLYDFLVVDVSVDVSEAGYYDISAWLASNSWVWITVGGNYTYLDSGLQTVEILFGGYKIHSSSFDGPYYAYLELYDGLFNLLESCTHTTQAYTWDQFSTPSAELVPPHGDHGLDADGDGMFDYLVIDVSVSVSLAGFYNFDCADLYDSSWHWISWADNRTYLDPGLQTVQILFEGDLIYTSGFSGPYCVGLDLCDSGGTELDSETYVTQTYTWNQFDPP